VDHNYKIELVDKIFDDIEEHVSESKKDERTNKADIKPDCVNAGIGTIIWDRKCLYSVQQIINKYVDELNLQPINLSRIETYSQLLPDEKTLPLFASVRTLALELKDHLQDMKCNLKDKFTMSTNEIMTAVLTSMFPASAAMIPLAWQILTRRDLPEFRNSITNSPLELAKDLMAALVDVDSAMPNRYKWMARVCADLCCLLTDVMLETLKTAIKDDTVRMLVMPRFTLKISSELTSFVHEFLFIVTAIDPL